MENNWKRLTKILVNSLQLFLSLSQSQGKNMKRIFVLGDSPEWNEMLKDEQKSYKDILQINFVDAYRNMTYKHLGGYW